MEQGKEQVQGPYAPWLGRAEETREFTLKTPVLFAYLALDLWNIIGKRAGDLGEWI